MRKQIKKSLAVILAAVMLFGVLTAAPFTVSAAESSQSVGASSGTTGDCTWILDDNGTLTISGNGQMGDYEYDTKPWGYNVKNVILENGVTSVGDNAFYGCESIASITIPISVTSVGFCAFCNCKSLTSITIPNSVTSIGMYAFEYCTNLTSITIPISVRSISPYMFWACQQLSDVYYKGNEMQWNSIEIGDGNNCLTSATIHYESLNTDFNIPNDAVELNGHCYKLYKETINWHQAKIKCETMGGHLATITSDEENDLVYSLIQSANVQSWLGGTDEEQEGVWKWITGEEWTYYPERYEFDNAGGVQHYLVSGFGQGDSIDKVWDDQSETPGTNLCRAGGYVCEWDNTLPDKSIAIYTTEKSLSIKTGKSISLGFGLFDNKTNTLENNWKAMAITNSNPEVVSLSDYIEAEDGYYLDVTGLQEGTSNLTITDTETGTYTIATITVYDNYVKTYSYPIENIRTFYPNNIFEKNIATNIYNLNGLYINNYSCIKSDGKYNISFDVYNNRYYYGAVDIYDANGDWKGFEEIDNYSDISTLFEAGERLFTLFDGNQLTYQHNSYSKHKKINIEVPDGGYFTISNNVSESPGAFLMNVLEITFDAAFDLIKAGDEGVDKVSSFSNLIESFKAKLKSDDFSKVVCDAFRSSLMDNIKELTKDFTKSELKDLVKQSKKLSAELISLTNNYFRSFDNRLELKELFKSVLNVGEEIFEESSKLFGPAGPALEACFSLTKASNKLMMIVQMAYSADNTYATVYSNISEGYIKPQGVMVNTNGNMDAEAVLQVFRVSNDDTVQPLLDNTSKQAQSYNISFVKNDQSVQPSGNVSVNIPIPRGMKGNTCKVYRKEDDGSWTILDAHVNGNYLVFETEHFSYYSVIGDSEELIIESLPSKTDYFSGELLDTSGMILKIGDEQITNGFICNPSELYFGNNCISVIYGTLSAEFDVIVRLLADTNLDGAINVNDVTAIQSHIADLATLTSAQLAVADINSDGVVDITDATYLQMYLAEFNVALGKQS